MSEANRDKKLSDASVHKLPTRFSLSYLGGNQTISPEKKKFKTLYKYCYSFFHLL